MLSTGSPFELDPTIASESEIPNDPERDTEAGRAEAAQAGEEEADWESSFEEGALGLCADGARKQDDDDDDSDLGFDDDDDSDEDEDLDDDFDDAADDDLDEGLDDFEDSDEL
ncbi:MAG: hypothetical protein ACE5I3_14555 [Phycisphaerae bacterium]